MSPVADSSKQEVFLPFARPSLSEEALQEVLECLRSGWITTGPRVQKFEACLREYLGVPHALTVSSATGGLHIALLALDLNPGDEVITPALSFVCTPNTIVQAGGTPVFVDIDLETYNLNLDQVKKKISSKTKAIVPVHYAGFPVDLDALYALADQHGLRVVEDCAHAIGTEYKGRKLGSFGDIQVFSFHPNKNMTTGEGGCIATRDPDLARRLQALRFHGIDREAWNRFSKTGSQLYDVAEPGFKYNMMDLQAALGLHQLPHLDTFISRRTALVQRYYEAMKDWQKIRLPSFPSYEYKHAWHLFNPLLLEMERDAFIEAMKAHNIGVGLHFLPCHLFKYYRERYGYKPGDFPLAERVGSSIVSLPLFPTMTFEEQERVITTMKTLLGERA